MNQNSALIWLPKIVEAGLPTPRTEIVHYDHRDVCHPFDGCDVSKIGDLEAKVIVALRNVGYPAFIRSDLSSAKHEGPDAYRIDDREGIAPALFRTIEDNESKFWLEPSTHGPKAILVREWLDLDGAFTAFCGHLIAREWRFFATNKEVLCFHPYWPEDAIEFFGLDEPEGWREQLRKTHEIPENLNDLKRMAIAAATAYGQTASVDFAMDKSGKWWLTDMATAGDSWHWPDCENCLDIQKKKTQIIR